MTRGLLFDFDGVVVDTEAPTYESWCRIYADHGAELALADWLPVVGSGTSTGREAVFDAVAHLERLVGTPLDREALVERRRRLKTELCDRAPLLPGVAELLADAARAGLKTAIVTRADRSWVDHHLARVALAHPWDALVCGDGRRTEPKATFYREALERLRLRSDEAVAFEDSPHGVRAARDAGIRCVAVPSAITREAAFGDVDLQLDSFADRRLTELLADLD